MDWVQYMTCTNLNSMNGEYISDRPTGNNARFLPENQLRRTNTPEQKIRQPLFALHAPPPPNPLKAPPGPALMGPSVDPCVGLAWDEPENELECA